MRYHGGKWKMAPWIISHFPNHRVYLEPFAGAASVLMRKPRSHSEIYNDRWGEIVNVFRVLRDPEKAEKLRQLCALTPFSRDEMMLADEGAQCEIERARRIIFRSSAGFGSASSNSLHKTGFRSSSRQSGNSPAMDWANWPDHIPAFVERLRGVAIENRDALSLIEQHDTAETLIYLDPPYVHSTRGMRRMNMAYRHEMSDEQHAELAAAIEGIESMVIISGYRCDLYDELYGDWTRIDREALADGASKRTESLWLNKRANRRQLQLIPHDEVHHD